MNRNDYPRCATCKHWQRYLGGDEGYCMLVDAMAYNGHLSRIIGTDEIPVSLLTRPEFGCIQHEPKKDA